MLVVAPDAQQSESVETREAVEVTAVGPAPTAWPGHRPCRAVPVFDEALVADGAGKDR